MFKFKQFVLESKEEKEAKLKHLEHPEDHFFNVGEEGYHHAIDTLISTHNSLLKQKNGLKRLSLKVDGAPSIIAGIHPENGKFFVSSKSLFNKTPKINYSNDDIDKNHSNSPGLANKLKLALKHLPKVIHSGIHQGDLIHDDDIKQIDKEHIHFKPNLVNHTVPLKSEEGSKIRKSKIGVAFHTSYSGKTIDNLKADYGKKPDFSEHPDVHLLDVSHDFEKTNYKPAHQKSFLLNINQAEKHANKNIFKAITPHGELLKQYVNHSIKKDNKRSVDGYKEYLKNKEKLPNKQNLIDHVNDNKDRFDKAFRLHSHLEAAKNSLVYGLGNKHKDYKFSTNGKETKPEGYVAVTKNGRPSKLVDRLEFSRNNFLSGAFQRKK